MTPEPARLAPLAAPQANIGLEPRARQEVCGLLNNALADEFVLFTKTRNYHWNVTGPNFPGLHKLFEEQYEILDEVLDDVAERVRALGGWAVATLDSFVARASIEEQEAVDLPDDAMLQDLMQSHEHAVRNIRTIVAKCEEVDDSGTLNLLEELIGKHEKMAWMLAATHANTGPAR